MIDQGIKSKPQYAPIEIDRSGRYHLLVKDRQEIDASVFASGTKISHFDEYWRIAGHSLAIPSPLPHATGHEFRAQSHMLIALRHYLNRAHMGLRMYVVGTEPFVWGINSLAYDYGLGPLEVRVMALGSRARRVFCNHCRTINEDVTTNIVTCTGCGARLFVRDHFSRRLNAFAGVQVDAEVPGEIPDIEELYS
jgi:dimethylamine monooxygenase subunit C